jgi:hypothetical protein
VNDLTWSVACAWSNLSRIVDQEDINAAGCIEWGGEGHAGRKIEYRTDEYRMSKGALGLVFLGAWFVFTLYTEGDCHVERSETSGEEGE